MKVSLKSKVITFGGLHLILKRISSKKLVQFIDEQLGNSEKTVDYIINRNCFNASIHGVFGGSAMKMLTIFVKTRSHNSLFKWIRGLYHIVNKTK